MLDRKEITDALADFKERRDTLLFGDVDHLEHHLKRLMQNMDTNPLVQQILQPILRQQNVNSEEWWQKLSTTWSRRGPAVWELPDERDTEFALRYRLIRDIADGDKDLRAYMMDMRTSKWSEAKSRFLNVIIRPFLQDLTRRLADEAEIPSDELRSLQAVPPERIPGNQTKIFLSHRSIDKKRVLLYYNALKELGFDPWLDEQDMPAGTNLDRGIKKGFKDSCAVIFFITENFQDERFIAEEIENAKIEKRNKGEKFAIITLLLDDRATVPDLLENYIYKTVKNDLEGFYQIIGALPIELGEVLWKEAVI